MLSRGPVATAAENEGQNNKTDFRDLHRPTISVSIEFAEFEIVKKMKEDRKIREFFHSVRPEVPDNVRFMSEFVRQVSLLPEPASFTKKQDQPGIEAVSSLIRISGQLKKQSVCLAVVACLAAVAMSFLIAVIVSAVPAVDFQQFLAGWPACSPLCFQTGVSSLSACLPSVPCTSESADLPNENRPTW